MVVNFESWCLNNTKSFRDGIFLIYNQKFKSCNFGREFCKFLPQKKCLHCSEFQIGMCSVKKVLIKEKSASPRFKFYVSFDWFMYLVIHLIVYIPILRVCAFVLKLKLQYLQVKGRTFVWVLICFFNIDGFLHLK